jgi:carotenoid 1,2-hydratase
VDALSEDRRHGLCLIAFLGSVFSPYYAAARRRAGTRADPLDHCAFNISLAGPGARWSMTERPRRDLRLDAARLSIGRSSLVHRDGQYVFELDELGSPWPRRVRGQVTLTPLLEPGVRYPLDEAGAHWWTPLAPRARIAVELVHPRLRWSGEAYFDSNRGTRPLENDFHGWDWSRSVGGVGGGARVYYATRHRREAARALALDFRADGQVAELGSAAAQRLALTRWGIRRTVHGDGSGAARLIETWVDAPFYARSLLAADSAGQTVHTVHESLDLDRFARRWVQWLLPFRMPRRAAQPAPSGPRSAS